MRRVDPRGVALDPFQWPRVTPCYMIRFQPLGPFVGLGHVLPIDVTEALDDDGDLLCPRKLPGHHLGGLVTAQLAGLDLHTTRAGKTVQRGRGVVRSRVVHPAIILLAGRDEPLG